MCMIDQLLMVAPQVGAIATQVIATSHDVVPQRLFSTPLQYVEGVVHRIRRKEPYVRRT